MVAHKLPADYPLETVQANNPQMRDMTTSQMRQREFVVLTTTEPFDNQV